MPRECLVLRKLESGDSQQLDTPSSSKERHSHPIPSETALNDLIRALENSPPEDDLSKNGADTDLKSNMGGGDGKLSAMDAHVNADLDATSNLGEENTKISAEAIGKKEKKKQNVVGRKKPTVSDDDDNSRRKKKRLKMLHPKRSPTGRAETAESPVVAMDDFISTIDEAVLEQRIDEKKAERLHECLQSGDWSEVAFSLLCEQIPLKRKGKGYSCRVCLVPKKGHTCQYCHICSTPEDKHKKDDDHVCVNCPICFEEGKKKKKLIQVKREGHICPHVAPP